MTKIDLINLFSSLESDLESAIFKGKILNNTKNIKESGDPLEYKFREVIGKRLPFPFYMSKGYLFDSDLEVTPQIDAMICDSNLSHEILDSIEGSSYLPYLCSKAVFEIKNSTTSIKKDLKQIIKICTEINSMHAGTKRRVTNTTFEPPFSMYILGSSKGIGEKRLRDAFSAISSSSPNFVYIVDRGIIISRKCDFFDFDRLSFLSRPAGPWWIYAANEKKERKPMALLWSYYAIISFLQKISISRPITQTEYWDFINKVQLKYLLSPLYEVSKITASQWKSTKIT